MCKKTTKDDMTTLRLFAVELFRMDWEGLEKKRDLFILYKCLVLNPWRTSLPSVSVELRGLW